MFADYTQGNSIRRFGSALLSSLLATTISLASVSISAQTSVEVQKALTWPGPVNTPLFCEVTVPTRYTISSHALAEVTWILPVGTLVEEGDVIARQSDTYIANSIASLKIDIENERSHHRFLQKEITRLATLSESNFIAEAEMNKLQRDKERVTLTERKLQEQLKRAQYRHRRLLHESPISGQIELVQAQPGEQLDIGENIAQILPIGNLELSCKLPLDILYRVHSIRNAEFSLDQHDFQLSRQRRDVEGGTQTLLIYLVVPESLNAKVLVGQRLQINMSEKVEDATRVPHDALVFNDEKHEIWRLNDKNIVSKHQVEILLTQESHFVIRSKVQADDRVVIRGKQGLEAGQEVSAVEKDD